MIKDCIVKLNNDAVTVVAFGDVDIQFPSIHRDAKRVYVSFANGKYNIVPDEYIEHEKVNMKTRRRAKKTTIEEAENTELVESV